MLQIEGMLDREGVSRLSDLLDHLATTATLVIELSRARSVDLFALVQLHGEVLRHRRLGREVFIRGLTLAQSRLLELAREHSSDEGRAAELSELFEFVV